MDVVFYPPSDPTSDHVPWSFYPIDSENDSADNGIVGTTVHIQENWHAGSDSRSGDWLSFTGTKAVLYPKDSTETRVPWKVVDSGSGDGTVFLQNLWGGPTVCTSMCL